MFPENFARGKLSTPASDRESGEAAVRSGLKNELERLGLFGPQRWYYLHKFVVTLSLFAISLYCVSLGRLWIVLPVAALLAFAGTQLGFLGHDLGHRQVFRNARKDDTLGLLVMNLLLGFSYGWWTRKHNEHHANPNHLDLDPDIRFPVIAFTLLQAEKVRWPFAYIIRFQALFFLPLLFFLTVSMWRDSVAFLVSSVKNARWTVEILLIAAHLLWYGCLVIGTLGVVSGILFIALHHAAFGLYLGLSFATNHKGMVMLDSSVHLGLLERQVITTRNLKAGPVVDFVFGPLGAQIEHHIFPDLPRNQLRKAADPVKSYCALRSIPYHETGVSEALREVFSHLQLIGRQLSRQQSAHGVTKYGKPETNR